MLGAMFRRYFWQLVGGGLLVGIGIIVTGGNKSVIQINYAMYPEVLDGCDVLIDGEVVGQLQPLGRNHVTGFQVDDGPHLVEIAHEELVCEPVKVQSGYGGRQVMLMAELGDHVTADGDYQTMVYLYR